MRTAMLCILMGLLPVVAGKAQAQKKASNYDGSMQVTNGGSITGTVKFAGKAEVIKLKTTKDQKTCHDEKDSPRLVVGAGGGLANAIVYLENITKGNGIEALPAGMLDQKDCEYIPHVQIHPFSKPFQIRSSDPILHNVHLNYREGDTTIANIPFPDATTDTPAKAKFKKPGLAYTKCDAGHIWMSSFIFATDNPYCAVTDAQGSFTIKDVPPGTYKLVMWHEGYQLKETQKDAQGNITGYIWSDDITQKKDVTVEAGKPVTVNFEMGGQS